MKEETNNEMDLLLRRLGRRDDKSAPDTNGDIDHLDTDELNAYAENVLPAAARTRYTEHLAECARCRELVVQLSSSAGVVPAVETVKAPEPSALRKFIASLFSPLVLRYAVPALGLIVVAAIGLLVLRQNKNADESIAQTGQAPQSTGVVTQAATPSESKDFSDSYDRDTKAAKPARSSGSPGDQVAAAAAPEAPPPAPTAVAAPADSVAKKEQQQPVATDSPAALATLQPGVATEAGEQQAKIESREVAQTKNGAEPAAGKSEEAPKTKSDDRKLAEVNAANSAPSGVAGGTFSGGRVQGAARARTSKDSESEDKTRDDSNTVTVAGRRFRKQGGVWVDTAYNFSRTAISVTRDSEQYRALIADEPSIKTIADQLDGEILVVWKGRPYRIK